MDGDLHSVRIIGVSRDLDSPKARAVVGELLGPPRERCASAVHYVDQPASYFASLIAPAPGLA